MLVDALELRRPAIALLPSYGELVAEEKALGERIWDDDEPKATESGADYVARLVRAEHDPAPDRVPTSIHWVTLDGVVVGRIKLRHRLTADLEELGGHVGYEVRPSFRRRGIATQMLRRLVATPEASAIGRLLLTCAPDNVGSNKTILANGGVLARTAWVERWKRLTNYYWIDARTAR